MESTDYNQDEGLQALAEHEVPESVFTEVLSGLHAMGDPTGTKPMLNVEPMMEESEIQIATVTEDSFIIEPIVPNFNPEDNPQVFPPLRVPSLIDQPAYFEEWEASLPIVPIVPLWQQVADELNFNLDSALATR